MIPWMQATPWTQGIRNAKFGLTTVPSTHDFCSIAQIDPVMGKETQHQTVTATVN